MTYDELTDAMETLSGPNREMDCRIALLCGIGDFNKTLIYCEQNVRFFAEYCDIITAFTLDEKGEQQIPCGILVPDFTNSIDAARMLVPPGWYWVRDQTGAFGVIETAWALGERHGRTFTGFNPASEACGLSAAALRARKAV